MPTIARLPTRSANRSMSQPIGTPGARRRRDHRVRRRAGQRNARADQQQRRTRRSASLPARRTRRALHAPRPPDRRPRRARERRHRESARHGREAATRESRGRPTSRSRKRSSPAIAVTAASGSTRPTSARIDGDDPEADDDGGLRPALLLEMVMQRRHAEDALAGELEGRDLHDHRHRLEHEQAADDGQHDLVLGRRPRWRRARRRVDSEPVSPMNTMAGGALNQRKPRPAPTSAPQKHRELAGAGDVVELQVVGEDRVADEVGDQREARRRRSSPARWPGRRARRSGSPRSRRRRSPGAEQRGSTTAERHQHVLEERHGERVAPAAAGRGLAIEPWRRPAPIADLTEQLEPGRHALADVRLVTLR